jgi:hypothetical protein
MDNQDWTPVVVKKTKPVTQITLKNSNPEYVLHKKLENEEIQHRIIGFKPEELAAIAL